MGGHFAKAYPEFDKAAFIAKATNNLDGLKLKERSDQISAVMANFLPNDFARAAEIMLASLAPEESAIGGADMNNRGVAGWAIMPMTHYVGLHGLGHFDLSMNLFKEMTKLFSSEFGVRFFLLEEPERTLSVFEKWTCDPNLHVRRLVSEGSRPRLPWAMRLPNFIADPSPIFPLLEALKDDGEEYVRRSVANNLNDIAKDHPDVVANLARRWLKGAGKDRKKLVRHACRTLVKRGHKGALKALGYGPPSLDLEKMSILTPRATFAEDLILELSLTSASNRPQPLIVD